MESWIKNRKIVLFILCIIIVASVYRYNLTPKQEAPDLTAPYAIITTVYPGASLEDVDKNVTSKIENALQGLESYDYSQSFSSNNVSVVVLGLKFQADLTEPYDQLADIMSEVQVLLPKECQKIVINDNVMETAGIIISLSGENYTYEELAQFADTIQKEITQVEGVARFDVKGKPEKQIIVEIKNELLGTLGLSYQKVVQLIQAQNVGIPLGALTLQGENEDSEGKTQLHIDHPIVSIQELENLVVGGDFASQQVVFLKDIANIHESYGESNYIIKHNGKNAVLLAGYFQKNQNIMIVGKEVEEKIQALKDKLPSDLQFSEVNYLPNEVEKSVNQFLWNLLSGIGLVILVVLIGMGFRNALIVSTAIPVSILMTFLVMPSLGMKIHQITITGLIVALGMLVDNAIVVSDAIQVKLDDGEERIKACVSGTKTVMIPIFTSTLTTIAAFSPLLFLNSIAGEYIKALPQVVIISLIASFVVAIGVTPIMAFIFFKPSKKIKKNRHAFRLGFEWLLMKGLKKPKTVILALLIILSASTYLAFQLNIIFFPKADKDIVYMDINAFDGSDISKTEEIAAEVMEILSKEKAISYYTTAIGSGLPRFYDTLSVYTTKSNFSQIFMRVNLEESPYKTNTEYIHYLQALVDGEDIQAKITVKQLEYIDPRGSTIGVRLTGDSIEEIEEIGDELKTALQSVPGAIQVTDDRSEKNNIYDLEINDLKALQSGLLQYDIQNEINIAIMGREATTMIGETNLPVIVQSDIHSLEAFKLLTLSGSLGQPATTLGEIATVVNKAQRNTIKKHNGQYSIYIGCEIAAGYQKQSIEKALQDQVDLLSHSSVNFQFEGENEKISQYFGEVGVLALFAGVLIYLILLIQFKSFMQPLVILCTIPLSLVGSILGLYLTKQPVSFTAALGIVSLMGVVVNNAIILLDYINYERSIGKSLYESCIDAVDKRFRPIMLTTITTVIGLLPLAFSRSELFKPMSIALMSGLMLSTLLTLVIIPIIYTLLISEKRQE